MLVRVANRHCIVEQGRVVWPGASSEVPEAASHLSL